MPITIGKPNNRKNGNKKPEESMDDFDSPCHMLGLPCLPGRKRNAHIASATRPAEKPSA
jgi:hypothetical protein